MIKLEHTEVVGLEPAIRGLRNPMNSWAKSDSFRGVHADEWEYEPGYCVGEADKSLMMSLAHGGSTHAKYRRMIVVYVDITAPLYWWKEFDTYKVGTVANSCSTMHKIHAKEFVLDDFSHEHLSSSQGILQIICDALNGYREAYLKAEREVEKKHWWWQMIQLLPSSYNQKRTIMLNYEVLAHIYHDRKDHRLDEWRELCRWIEKLPYSEVITCGVCD